MYYTSESRASHWDDVISLSPALLEELRFWLFNFDSFNGYSIRPSSCPSMIIYTDASDVAFGGYSSTITDDVRGMWLPDEASMSSTYRELKAISNVLTCYKDNLKSTRVVVKTDSQSAARIISVGSSKRYLQSVAMDIFRLCLSNGITLQSQWIPRSLNGRADLLSRFVDPDDWSLHPSVFRMLDCRFDPHSVDRFASHYTAQVNRFNSKFACPYSCGVDAFTQNWSNDNNWLCPPTSLIVQCIRHLEECGGSGTLIVPEWRSAIFWPFLHDCACGSFKEFVKVALPLPNVARLRLRDSPQPY